MVAELNTSLRLAGADDAGPIGSLHADSWRRHYRGAYADSFLDGDVVADRRSLWSARLETATTNPTFVAETAETAEAAETAETAKKAEAHGRIVGFIHVVIDQDPRWGSLIDNLHVAHDKHRGGIGTALLVRAAGAVLETSGTKGMHLWVLEQNTAAQRFYRACGATQVETATVSPPGGDPSRLHGTPRKLRMSWPDATALLRTERP